MEKIQILHNNRCGKSRSAIKKLEESGKAFEIIPYLEGALNEDNIENLLKKLNKEPLEIIRTNEALFKENYKGKNFSKAEWISILKENPILIERPILIFQDKAIVGRPEEIVDEFIKNIH